MGARREVTLDLTGCKKSWEIHQKIKETLNFPDYYGCNWDAFWDCLRFECPMEYIRVVGEQTIPEDVRKCLTAMHELLEECKKERTAFGLNFDYEIAD